MKDVMTVPNILMAVIVALMAWLLTTVSDLEKTAVKTELRIGFVSQQLIEMKTDLTAQLSSKFSTLEGQALLARSSSLENRLERTQSLFNTLNQRVMVLERGDRK